MFKMSELYGKFFSVIVGPHGQCYGAFLMDFKLGYELFPFFFFFKLYYQFQYRSEITSNKECTRNSQPMDQ